MEKPVNPGSTPLGLIGAGGHGKVVADTARAAGWTDISFFDPAFPERRHNGEWPIVGTNPSDREGAMFCAIGDNATRARIFAQYDLRASPALCHPSAILSPSVRLGSGTLIVAGAIVNADAQIGQGAILNTGCSVDHDCVLGDFVHISPGARLAGNVHVGARSWIGIGAVIREGIRVGCDAVIGAGAAVIADVPDGVRMAGVPARPIAER
jgi:sugar O-acyltransferase (sialic acid O-acetyltransferase NeuD family)